MKIRTLFISDVHLGNKKSSPDYLLKVLKEYDFENLIIIGDFIDLTSLKKKFYWKPNHSKVIQKILKLSKKVKVTYILGNHDFYLRSLLEDNYNIMLGNISIQNEMIYKTKKGKNIYICHGDQFDGFVRLNPILYNIGDWAYELSFKINRIYNFFRKIFNLNEWSLSSYLKNKVKNILSYINNFKVISTQKAKSMECDSIMIGHIHTPAIEIGVIDYYNTGDFCESCSFIIETLEGEIILVKK
jgi:UDP-2,3-diacylglucosamine pyrophosphatase LpxH